jgi:hypothetical protein
MLTGGRWSPVRLRLRLGDFEGAECGVRRMALRDFFTGSGWYFEGIPEAIEQGDHLKEYSLGFGDLVGCWSPAGSRVLVVMREIHHPFGDAVSDSVAGDG